MNKRNMLKQGVLCVAILAMATFIPSASASVVGHLVVGTCPAGDVVVSSVLIDWQPNIGGGIVSCLSVSGGTNVVSVGSGTLTSPPVFTGVATINDLTVPSSGGEAGFMSFILGGPTPVNLIFDLTGLGPGIATPCSSSIPDGGSCSIPGSPFLLTKNNRGTSVSLSANGTIMDTVGPISYWSGAFTTQINNRTPSLIQSTILGGLSITSSFSGEFDVAPVPEPISMVLIGGGLIALGAIKRRRQQEV